MEEKILLKTAKDKEFDADVKSSEDLLNKLTKQLDKISKEIVKRDPMTRFFVVDAIIGGLFQSSKLPPYIIGSIASKYWLYSTLPNVIPAPVEPVVDVSSYVG